MITTTLLNAIEHVLIGATFQHHESNGIFPQTFFQLEVARPDGRLKFFYGLFLRQRAW